MKKQVQGKLLIVENDQLVQQSYRTQISPLVKKLTIVENATNALKLIKKQEIFDLILVSIGLPENGLSLGKKFRRNGVKSPMIAVSLNSLQIELKMVYRSVFDDFFVKPLTEYKLKKLIDKYFER